jgi:hypothetical protein
MKKIQYRYSGKENHNSQSAQNSKGERKYLLEHSRVGKTENTQLPMEQHDTGTCCI